MKFRFMALGSLFALAMFAVSPIQAAELVSNDTEPVVSAAEIEEYWTEERMKGSLEMLMPSPDSLPGAAAKTTVDPKAQADGPAGISPSRRPGKNQAALSADSAMSISEYAGSTSADNSFEESEEMAYTMDYTWPFPFTMHNVRNGDMLKWPYRSMGRIFFTTSSGFNSSCSGSSIGNRAVLTAGHCVSNGAGSWYTNHIFRPAYHERAGGLIVSVGSWTSYQLTTFTAWHNGNSYCRDVGFVKVNDRNGLTLQQKVGALGHAYNGDATHKHWTGFGYPAEQTRTTPNYNFDGSRMYENNASFAEWGASWFDHDSYCNAGEPTPFCFGTYYTGGASGGPVVWKFDAGYYHGGIYPGSGSNYANGVNSTYYQSGRVAGALCSPYFDTDVHDAIVSVWE